MNVRCDLAHHGPWLLILRFIYKLDGYPASLGFPVMHRVHAMAYAPNLKGRFVNGWFVNILPPLLPLFLAQSLLHSLPPSPLSLAPSMPRSVLSSLVPFINPPLNPPFLHWRSLPPSLRSNLLATAPPHPTQCRPTSCVCVELASCAE